MSIECLPGIFHLLISVKKPPYRSKVAKVKAVTPLNSSIGIIRIRWIPISRELLLLTCMLIFSLGKPTKTSISTTFFWADSFICQSFIPSWETSKYPKIRDPRIGVAIDTQKIINTPKKLDYCLFDSKPIKLFRALSSFLPVLPGFACTTRNLLPQLSQNKTP